MVARAEDIRAFAPTLAICGCGPTESLVHPGPVVRNAIDRWGPRSWRGITGLEPRVRYSRHSRQRVQQQISAAVKACVKRAIITMTGGRRSVSVAETRDSLDALVSLLAELDVKMVFTDMPLIDEHRFPGARESFAATDAVLREALDGRADAVLVSVKDALHYYDDFLKDNAHLDVSGHQRVAGLVAGGAQRLLTGSASAPEAAGDASPVLNA
jgi:hypothetical protein